MNSNELVNLINDEVTEINLTELLKQYPYFQLGHILNWKTGGNELLRKAAVYSPDRKMLASLRTIKNQKI